jgi:hypothetical protein
MSIAAVQQAVREEQPIGMPGDEEIAEMPALRPSMKSRPPGLF